MRKIIALIHMSLDGYVAGPNGEMDWIVYNDDVEKYAHDLHDVTDAAIYGRVTFQMMEAYWTTVLDDPQSTEPARNHARWTNAATKYVISTTLKETSWQNTVFIEDNIAAEINAIKNQPGKDIWFLGSPSTAQTFLKLGLIDEYRVNVNPVVLGNGKPFFPNLDQAFILDLIESQTFEGGVVGLRYAPKQA